MELANRPSSKHWRLRQNDLMVEAELASRLSEHAGYHAIQSICGVGKIIAAIFVAEIGDVSRPLLPAPVLLGGHDAFAQKSQTPMCNGAISLGRATTWCDGRPSNPSPTTTVASR